MTINWKRNLIFVSLSRFLAMIGFGCCMPFIPLCLRENFWILDDQLRGFYVSIFSFAGITSLCVATAIWGMLADKFGRKLMLLRASYGAAVFYPLLVLAPNFWWMVAVRFFCSFFFRNSQSCTNSADLHDSAGKTCFCAWCDQCGDLERRYDRLYGRRHCSALFRFPCGVSGMRTDLFAERSAGTSLCS